MRVLLLPFYHGLGHVVRTARIGAELAHRGVEVTFAAAEGALPIGEANGLESVAVSELPPFSPEKFVSPPKERPGKIRLADATYLETALSQERELIRSIRADFVLVDFRVTGAISAQLEGVPSGWIANAGFFSHPLPAVIRDVVPELQRLGVAREVAENLFGDYLYVPDWSVYEPLSDVFASSSSTHLTNIREVRHVGPVLKAPLENLISKVEARKKLGIPLDQPFVFVTLGGSAQGYGYLQTIVPKLEKLTLNSRVVTGPNINPGDFASSGEVELVRFESDPMLWARAADIVITHGGHTSTMESAAVGTPVLVIPGHAEQQRTADFVERNRIGGWVAPSDLNSEFEAKVREVLEAKQYLSQAQEFATVMQQSDGASELADHIIRNHTLRKWN